MATSWGTLSSEDSRKLVAEVLGFTAKEYAEKLQDGEMKNMRLLAYIKQLRKHYKTGMLSNVSPKGLEARFSDDELTSHFDAVVASGVVGFAKPEARAYEIIAERLAVRLDECVMIDDREPYCEGARAVGMQAIHYQSFEQMQSELGQLLVIA